MKRIPIKSAKDIAKQYDASVVVIVAWDGKTGTQHVTTFGKSKQECGWAADLGNQIKRKILKWPEEECIAVPARLGEKDKFFLERTGELAPCGDEEERTCETCGVRMIVPGKSGTTECSKCLE